FVSSHLSEVMYVWFYGWRYCFCSCLFFQAEDGIRDRNVTGVQTCALPISRSSSSSRVRTPSTAASKPLRGCSSTVRRPRTPAIRRPWPPRSSRPPERSRAEAPGALRPQGGASGAPGRSGRPPLEQAPASAVVSPSRRMDYYRVGADALSAHRLLSSVGRAPLL